MIQRINVTFKHESKRPDLWDDVFIDIDLTPSMNSPKDSNKNLRLSVYIHYQLKTLVLNDAVELFWNEKYPILHALNNGESLDAHKHAYFCQAINENVYRKILYFFNEDKNLTVQALISIRELATMRESGISPQIIRNTSFIKENITSDKDMQYAYELGVLVLFDSRMHLLNKNEVFKESIKFNICSSKSEYDLILDYKKQILPTDINALVGANGSGKTYAINEIVKQITDPKNPQRPPINHLVLFSNTIKDGYLDKKNTTHSTNSKSDFVYVNMISQKKYDAQLSIRSKYSTTAALRGMLLRDYGEYGVFQKKILLIDTLKRIFDFSDIQIPLIGNPRKKTINLISDNPSQGDLAYFDTKKDFKLVNDFQEPTKLSSGQNTFIRFLSYALSCIEQNSLIIYDEPENFLHPNLEIMFLEIFEQILRLTDSIGLIATHSSVMIRELPSSSVNILIHDEDGYFVAKPNIETFGANLQTISNYVFGDFESTKLHQNFIQELTKNAKSIDEMIKKYEHLDASILSQMILLAQYK